MADTFTRGPYQQDPFDHIIAIHFPHGNNAITKLDFVNNRYMVKGKTQALADVVVEPEYRVAQGLDTRGRDDADAVEIVRPPRTAHLRNKVDPPTKTNPGALNEFLFLGGTVVAEFDTLDFGAAYDLISGYDPPRGYNRFYPIMEWRDTEADRYFSVTNAEVYVLESPLIPAYDETVHHPFSKVHDVAYYDTGCTTEAELNALFDSAQVGHPIHYFPSPSVFAFGTYWVDGAALDGAGITKGTGPYYLWHDDRGFDVQLSPTQPDDNLVIVHHNEVPAVDYFKAVPDLAVFEQGDYPVTGRSIGANVNDPIGGPGTPVTNGGLSTGYGRTRIAITATGIKLAASINGGPAVIIGGDSLFGIPQVPPDFHTYFPAGDRYKVIMALEGFMRCIWLFRKPKANDLLHLMSAVQPLPAATSPKWTKPPGQDQ